MNVYKVEVKTADGQRFSSSICRHVEDDMLDENIRREIIALQLSVGNVVTKITSEEFK